MSTFEAVPRDESPIRMSLRTGRWMSKTRQVRLPMIALVALVALGTGIFATATQPQTTLLRHEVTSLTGALNRTHQQISVLQSSLAHAASQGTRLQGAVGSLQHRVGGLQGAVGSLQHRVGGLQGAAGSLQHRMAVLRGNVGELQSSVGQLRAQSRSLVTCVPQLQQELHGLHVRTTNVGGLLTSASLASPTIVPKDCTKPLPGS
jgi:uncharacterized protein (DUF3084 family)